jgi:hypothetical protein
MAVTSAWAVGSLSRVTRFDAPATTLPSFTTVGAGSCVHGIFTEQKTVLAGNPAQIVRRSVMWDGH